MAKTNTRAAKPAAATPKRTAAKPRTPRLPRAVGAAVRSAQDKKAADIVVLDLRKAGGFTDYFVICTGNNARQINAIADAVEDTLRNDLGERPALSEGVQKSEWILLDYFNFVVHVFSPDCRAFYGLERLWGSAERIEVPAEA
ncbi:MAG: ribosome silencing factor [Vicinamibacterales bacterium]